MYESQSSLKKETLERGEWFPRILCSHIRILNMII